MTSFRTQMLAPFRSQHSRNGRSRPLTTEELQAQERASDPFWKMLTNPKPDKSAILLTIEKDQHVLERRDHAGATPLLYLALLNSKDHVDIAKELLQRDLSKRRIADRYDSGPYKGENILHIAIVNKDLSFAKTLLEMNKDILLHRATGTFFKEEGSCPWGELPLSFAAASNQPLMVDLLLRYEADISGRSAIEGYTAMHMAVRFNMQDMYEKLAAIYQEKKGEEELKKLERSCLRFAALEGCKEMFAMILDRSSAMLWQYGPISTFSYPISFLELVDSDEHSLNQKSTIQILIDNEQLKLIVSPVVSKFIDMKWDKYGERRFRKRFISFAVYLVVFTLAIILPDCRSPTSGPLQRWTRAACEVVLLAGACVKGYIELLEMSAEGPVSHFWLSAGAIKIENFASASACFSILAAALLRISPIDHQSDYEECFWVVAALSAWGYAFFFLLGWKFTGPFVLMFVKVIQKDVAVLGLIFLVILGGFTSCSIILGHDDGFAVAANHVWNCSTAVLGDPTFTQSTPHHHPLKSALNVWLSFSFVFVNCVILLNLLIAKMGDTYRHYEESAEESWQMERARILESFDREMDSGEKDTLLQHCWITLDTSNECFLLLERKDPDFYETSPENYSDTRLPEETEEQVEEAQGTPLIEVDTTKTPTRSDNGRAESIGDMNNVEVDKKLRQFSPVLHSVFGGME